MEATNATAPVIQVGCRLPRQAAIQNLPHGWITMKKKNSSVLQRCRLLTNSPTLELCHHAGPSNASHAPDARIITNAARVRTPNT